MDSAQTGEKPNHGAIRDAGLHMAMLAQKDLNWKALAGKDAAAVIAAFHKERGSLLDTVLTLMDPSDPHYSEYRLQSLVGSCLTFADRAVTRVSARSRVAEGLPSVRWFLCP